VRLRLRLQCLRRTLFAGRARRELHRNALLHDLFVVSGVVDLLRWGLLPRLHSGDEPGDLFRHAVHLRDRRHELRADLLPEASWLHVGPK
jgi:hypothetical protein